MSFPSLPTSGNRSPSPVGSQEDLYTSGPSSPLGALVQNIQNISLEPETQGACAPEKPTAPEPSTQQELLMAAMQSSEWHQNIHGLSSAFKNAMAFTFPTQALKAYYSFDRFQGPIPDWLWERIEPAMKFFESKFHLTSSMSSFRACSNAWDMLKDKPASEIEIALEERFHRANVLSRDQLKQLIFCYLNGGEQFCSKSTNLWVVVEQLGAMHPQLTQELSYEYCLSSGKVIFNNGFEFFSRYNMQDLQSMYNETLEDTNLEYG